MLNIFNGIGFLVDWKTPKKWYYPGLNADLHYKELAYLEIVKKLRAERREKFLKNHKKGAAHIRLNLPFVSSYNVNFGAQSRRGVATGILFGVDYFYRNNTFIDISWAGMMNAFYARRESVGMDDKISYTNISATNNHVLGKGILSLGYGISYGRNKWNTINSHDWCGDATWEEINQPEIYRRSSALGLATSVYLYTRHSFYGGISYRPMLWQFTDKTRFRYQHTLSFDFGWRIKL
jgi:hypothetical protein